MVLSYNKNIEIERKVESMERIDLYYKLQNTLNEIGIRYSQCDMMTLVNDLEMAIEDDSKCIYVSNGWEDIEIKVEDIIEN